MQSLERTTYDNVGDQFNHLNRCGGTTMQIEDEMKRTVGLVYTGTYAGNLRRLPRDQSAAGMSPKFAVLFILPCTVATAHSSLRSLDCVFMIVFPNRLRAELYE